MSSTPVASLSKAELNQLAVSYAAFVLGGAGAKVSADTIQSVLTAAGVQVEKVWVNALAKTLASRPVTSFFAVSGGASAPAASSAPAAKEAPKKEEKKEAPKKEAPPPVEEEGVDMGGLFDF